MSKKAVVTQLHRHEKYLHLIRCAGTSLTLSGAGQNGPIYEQQTAATHVQGQILLPLKTDCLRPCSCCCRQPLIWQALEDLPTCRGVRREFSSPARRACLATRSR